MTCPADPLWPALASLFIALSGLLTLTLFLQHRPRSAPPAHLDPDEPPLDRHVRPAGRRDVGP